MCSVFHFVLCKGKNTTSKWVKNNFIFCSCALLIFMDNLVLLSRFVGDRQIYLAFCCWKKKTNLLMEIFRDELASQSLGRILERRLFMSRLLFSIQG
jgi:hypothetical protein